MAVRFLFRKISNRISGSRCLLSAHASASASDAAPVTCRASDGSIGTLRKFSDGAAARPSTVERNPVIHAYEGGTGVVSNHLRGASAQPATAVFSNRAMDGYAARYFNSFPCSCRAAKTVSPTTGMPSVITHHAKPAFVGPVRGVKRTFSSSTARGTKMNPVLKAFDDDFKRRQAQSDKIIEAIESQMKASDDAYKKWAAQLDKRTADFNRFVYTILWAWTFAVCYWAFRFRFGAPRGGEIQKS